MKMTIPMSLLILTTGVFAAPEKIHVGRYASRAHWTPAAGAKAPAVILVPGSGAHGPEERIPGSLTADGRDHSLFEQLSEPFQRAGLHTLALGKPGVEFFTSWDPQARFYDGDLYRRLRWADLVENLAEAVRFLRARKNVSRIYVLGHSEGTQVAVDYAATDPHLAGLILLGYSGEDIKTTLDWQLFRRAIDHFIRTDVDADGDGAVSRAEAAPWKEFQWPWQPGQERVTYAEIEAAVRATPALQAAMKQAEKAPLYGDGIFARGPLYDRTAALPQPVTVFTGELDLQTRAEESRRLARRCAELKKTDCRVHLVPGLGHGFSPPRAPRAHPLLDLTVGPIDPGFRETLYRFAGTL